MCSNVLHPHDVDFSGLSLLPLCFSVTVTHLFIWWCVRSFPALVLFVVLAFFSWLVFLGGLRLIFALEGSLSHRAQSTDISYVAKAHTHTFYTHIHGKAPILPWMMQLPCHKPLSVQCHPIYLNHHSGKENNRFRASAGGRYFSYHAKQDRDNAWYDLIWYPLGSWPDFWPDMFTFASPALWKRMLQWV